MSLLHHKNRQMSSIKGGQKNIQCLAMKKHILPAIGVLGTLICIILYIREPSFPTPDKFLVFAVFVAMIFSESIELLKRFSPFVALILVYESFRGIADYLNKNVNFDFMIDADKLMFFGTLPTVKLQQWLWHGQLQWYDFALYLAYMMHFVFPLLLAVVIWKKFPAKYWNYMSAFVVLMFSGFLTYVLFPAAPPWMASDLGYIESIQRISSHVWYAFGITDFPSVYNRIAPNPVAAVPSLHAGFSVLFAMYVSGLFKSKWRYLSWLYPAMIIFGTVYMGEHYIIDAMIGALYAIAAYKITPLLAKKLQLSEKLSKLNFVKVKKAVID